MTIQEAIDRVDMIKPNQFSFDQKLAWLSELDGKVFKELILTHENAVDPDYIGYDAETPTDTQLLVPFPYTDVYFFYLCSQIGLGNAEIAKYNNDKQLFNNAYLTYSDYYTRTHMPLTTYREFVL